MKSSSFFLCTIMPTPQELQQRQRDEQRMKDEDAKAITARKVVLKKRQSEIAQNKTDLDRQSREIATELAGL